MSAPDLSIIIVTWNTRILLQNCLYSIFNHTHRYSYEIWVVDNNSEDGTVEMIYTEFPDVQVIANDYNAGFARANNQAFSRVQGRYVVLLNPDTVLLNDAFDLLVDYLERDITCGAVGPKLLNEDGTFQGTCARTAPGIKSELRRALGLRRKRSILTEENQNQSRFVEAVSGACVVVRRDLFGAEVLNDTYFMFVEDLELCWAVRRSGKGVYYLSDAQVLHLEGQSSKQTRHLAVEESFGIYQYFRSTRGLTVAVVSRCLSLTGALFRFPIGVYRWFFRDRELASNYLSEITEILLWAVGLNGLVGKTR